MNTLDGFQDFDGSGETCLEEEKNGKSGDCQPVDKSDDGCAASKKKSSDGIMFNESDEFECSKSAAVVIEIFGFFSEWFRNPTRLGGFSQQ